MRKRLFALSAAICLLLAVFAPTALASNTGAYGDISGKWYESDAAQYGYEEIFSDGSGAFRADKPVTRLEFARMLHEALGISINYFAQPHIGDSFSDVADSDKGAGDLIDLVTAGIVESGGPFNPQQPLDRATMVHWVMNALEYESGGFLAVPAMMPPPFDDDASIPSTYKNDVINAVILKLIYGRGNNLFAPNDGTTRAEAVTVVSRLMTRVRSIRASVIVTPSVFEENGSLVMNLTIANRTDKTVTINNPSGQRYDFQLFDKDGNNLYTWSADKLFNMMVGTTRIAPGEAVGYRETLDAAAYASVKGRVSVMKASISGTSEDFAVNLNGYSIYLK